MEEMTKKTLGEMIGEMLQTEDLNTSQMQIITMARKTAVNLNMHRLDLHI